MSYINDALRKAQQDKKSPYAAYEPLLSPSGKKIPGGGDGWPCWGFWHCFFVWRWQDFLF